MNRLRPDSSIPMLVLTALIFVSTSVAAQECAEDLKPVTVSDDAVPVEVLTFRVRPLTKCELEVEAQAWQALLQAKVAEISDAEVARFYEKEAIAGIREADSALEDAREATAESDEETAQEAQQEAAEALQEVTELETELSRDAALQEAIEAAADNLEQTGEAVAVESESEEDRSELKNALAA